MTPLMRGRGRSRAATLRCVCMLMAVALLTGLTACQPQDPNGTPSGCQASLSGSVRDGELVSGRMSAELNFPANAEVQVTGSVTNISSLFGAAMSWQLPPLVVGRSTPAGETTNVDETWQAGDPSLDVDVYFEQLTIFTTSYDFDFTITSNDAGCPPKTFDGCAAAGGNVFFEEQTVVDDNYYEGCYFFPDSCIDDIATDLSDTQCDEDDILNDILGDGIGFVALVGGTTAIAVEGAAPAAGATAGGGISFGTLLVVGVTIGIVVVAVAIVYIAVNDQEERAAETDPTLVEEAPEREGWRVRNPYSGSEEDREFYLRVAMATCVREIAIDEVIAHAADFGLDPNSIDPESGMVTSPTGADHLCGLLPVYVVGGSTSASGVPTEEAGLHIHDVLFGEEPLARDNFTPAQPAGANSTAPQRQWQILSSGPSGAAERWYRNLPYSCQATLPQACDEWPWRDSRQGGPANQDKPGAHLRYINSSHNSASGSDYNSFRSTCNVGLDDQFVALTFPEDLIVDRVRSQRLCPPGPEG